MLKTELTEQQIAINANPLYWEWFEEWWAEDFSAEAMDAKLTKIGGDQSHLRRYTAQGIINFAERNWHAINLPPHDLGGNLVANHLKAQSLTAAVYQYRETPKILGLVRNDLGELNTSKESFYFSHLSAYQARRLSCEEFQKCFFGSSMHSVGHLPTPTGIFRNCYMNGNLSFLGHADLQECHYSEKILLNGSKDHYNLKLTGGQAKHLDLMNWDAIVIEQSSIKIIKLLVSGDNNSLSINQADSCYPTKIQIAGKSPKSASEILLKLPKNSSIELDNINITGQQFTFVKLAMFRAEKVTFHKGVSLPSTNYKVFRVFACNFLKGITAVNCDFQNHVKILGSTFFEKADFRSSCFHDRLTATPTHYIDSSEASSIFHNANFNGAIFKDRKKTSNSYAVNFNDTEFYRSCNFDNVLFDGVPKFHGSQLHSETSFRDLKPIPDIDGNDLSNDGLYSAYQTAFRALRQHMEKNNSFSDAFDFGRREMISKQRRTSYVDVPRQEVIATRIYGALADYGQTFLRPLKFLFIAFLFSLAWQLSVFALGGKKCFLFASTCSVSFPHLWEAVERSLVFSIPPFTLLTGRSLGSNNNAISDGGALYIQRYIDALSGAGMVIHAMFASLMIFLVGLAIKRRLQIR